MVEFRHPVATLSTDITVVPDERGESAPIGDYAGTWTQTHAGSRERSTIDEDYSPEEWTTPFNFSLDENGSIKNLSGEFWWVCVGSEGYIDSGYTDISDSTDLPGGAITVISRRNRTA